MAYEQRDIKAVTLRSDVADASDIRSRAAVWTGTVAIAAAGGASLVILATAKYGPALSPDSTFYLSAAQHLSAGHGLTDFAGRPLVQWPPGFPLAVSAASEVFGVGVVQAARIINVLSLVAIVFAAAALLRRHVRSRMLQTLGIAAAAAAPPLVFVATYAWSEPLFIALSLTSVICVERALDAPDRAIRWALVGGLSAAAAFTTRYIGVTLCLALPPVLLLQSRAATRLRVRVLRSAAFLLPVAGAMVAVAAHNLAAGAPAFGRSGSPIVSFAGQLHSTWAELASWLFPRYVASNGVREAAGAVVAVVVVLLVGYVLRRDRRVFPIGTLPLVAFTGSYLFVLEASTTQIWVNSIDPRLMSPLFIPLLVLCLVFVETIAEHAPEGGWPTRLAVPATLGIVLAWTLLSVLHGADVARTMRSTGGGYTTYQWRHSALARAVRGRRPAAVYSNAPDAVWATTGLDAKCPPRELGRAACDVGAPIWGELPESTPPVRVIDVAWFRSVAPSTEPFARVAQQLVLHSSKSYADGDLVSAQVKSAR